MNLTKNFERYPLTFGPSPIEKLSRLSKHLGGNVDIYAKRDDCNSGLAFGGNKIRKLEYLIPEALAQGCDTLVTIGGVQSNHTRQVAAVAAKLGLKCRLVQESWVPFNDAVYDRVGNILMSRVMGAEIELVDEGFDIGIRDSWERALEPTSAFAFWRSRTHGLDRVGSRTEFVCRDVRDQGCLSRSVGGVTSRAAQVSCGSIGGTPCCTGLRHRDFSTRPSPSLGKRLAWSLVRGSRRLEEVQDMFRTRCGPQGEEVMICICKRSAATDGDEAGVADFGKDHGCTVLSCSSIRATSVELYSD
jgi:Pyridoxal-phosphate dependent enzyme